MEALYKYLNESENDPYAVNYDNYPVLKEKNILERTITKMNDDVFKKEVDKVIKKQQHILKEIFGNHYQPLFCTIKDRNNYLVISYRPEENDFGNHNQGYNKIVCDSNGELILPILPPNIDVHCLDEDNFLILHTDGFYQLPLITSVKHYSFEQGDFHKQWKLARSFKNTGANVVGFATKKLDHLVDISYMDYRGEIHGGILYNYHHKKVMLEDYDCLLECHNLQHKNLLFVNKSIIVLGGIYSLEFIINSDGEIVSDVIDYNNNLFFSKKSINDMDQCMWLTNIYESIKTNEDLLEYNKDYVKKRLKKQELETKKKATLDKLFLEK